MKLRDFTLTSWDVNLVCQPIINRFYSLIMGFYSNYYTIIGYYDIIMGFYQSWDVSFPSPTDPTKTPRETEPRLETTGQHSIPGQWMGLISKRNWESSN